MSVQSYEDLMLEYFESLYSKYSSSLNEAYSFAAECSSRAYLEPQFGVYESDLLFLLARESNPNHIVEISPCGGYSSVFLYKSLTRNEQKYESFDIHDRSERNLPNEVRSTRKFHLGDAKEHLFDDEIDFLLMDSDHSYEFCDWYVKSVFPAVKRDSWIFVNDIFDHDGGWYHEKFPYCGTVESSPKGREGNRLVEFFGHVNLQDYFNIQKNASKLLDIRRSHGVIDLPANIDQAMYTLSSSVIFKKSF